MRNYHGSLTIGLLTSRMHFEGPLWKDRTSFIISARRSYADLIIKPFMDKDTKGGYYLYDINTKLNHRFSDRDRLFFAGRMLQYLFLDIYSSFDEKPLETNLSTVSTGIYVVRRRLLIELLEKAAEEDRYDFVRDILVRYRNIKKIYGYKLDTYWNNISSVDSYYKTNMDFLKRDVRDYFFKQYPDVYSKVEDLPPAKYNYGANVSNSLVSSGCIVNGTVDSSVLFKKIYIGNNAVVKNSIIMNNAYIGDNAYIENCIVESNSTIKANSRYVGENGVKIVIEDSPSYY